VHYFHRRAERAEQWLSQIASEIEQRFLGVSKGARPEGRPQHQKGHLFHPLTVLTLNGQATRQTVIRQEPCAGRAGAWPCLN
jgi:hypothetical protein